MGAEVLVHQLVWDLLRSRSHDAAISAGSDRREAAGLGGLDGVLEGLEGRIAQC